MSGGRDDAGLEAGTTRSMAGDRLGGAEVHGGLHAGSGLGGTTAMGDTGRPGTTTDEYAALSFSRSAEQEGVREKAANRIGGMAESVKDLGGRASELADQARSKLGDVAGSARERLAPALDRAETLLDRAGVMDRVRQNPLPALGIAFGVGFILAGSGERAAPVKWARKELRGAVLGGLAAALAREARSYVTGAGGGMLESLMDRAQGGGSGSSPRESSFSATGQVVHRAPSHRENF
jgi:ElaB/YqjD/DUF883 family membrane-anchored ribosome-binding protein